MMILQILMIVGVSLVVTMLPIIVIEAANKYYE